MEKLSNVFGVHYGNDAVAHYRLWQPFEELSRQGLLDCKKMSDSSFIGSAGLSELSGPGGVLAKLEEYGPWAQLIVFQRVGTLLSLSMCCGMREAYGTPLIAEVDDDLFSVEPSNATYNFYKPTEPGENVTGFDVSDEDFEKDWKHRKDVVFTKLPTGYRIFTSSRENGLVNTTRFLREADAVTTTTEHLAKIFREYNPYVYVLPNCLDRPTWDEALKNKRVHSDGKIHFGWLGGAQHFDDLKQIQALVPYLLDKYPNLVFHMTDLKPAFWANLEGNPRFIHHGRAPIRRWPNALADIGLDFALVPLNSARFNLSKSNLKLLEYGALKIPAVYSKFGPYEEVSGSGGGMVAENRDEWLSACELLIKEPLLRENYGTRGYNYVYEHYDMAKRAGEWKTCYEEVYNRSRKSRLRETERIRRKHYA